MVRLVISFHFGLISEPGEEEELEAEADSPDMDPGTEQDQGKDTKRYKMSTNESLFLFMYNNYLKNEDIY